ncbi:EamA family transporter [Candidatus Woesearchaeota archaeon]|nr:EamA family transporter [Candidatus Woesearchaeota archaeon]
MGMNWVLLALLSYAIWAVCNILAKVIRDRHIRSSFSYTVLVGFIGLVSLAVIPFTKFSIPPPGYLILAIITGMLYFLAILPFLKALSMEEVSRVIPLWQMKPVFVLVLAWVLIGERLAAWDYAGFALILAGGMIIQTRTFKGLLRPGKAFYLMLFSSIVFAIIYTLVKYLYLHIPYAEGFVFTRIGTFLASVLALAFFSKQRKKFTKTVREVRARSGMILLSTEILNIIAVGISYYAITLGPISIISVFEGFQPAFVLLYAIILSVWFPEMLREHIDRKTLLTKIAAIALMTTGLYFIYV